MNVGYSNATKDHTPEIDNAVCPVCGSNIYVSKYQNDFACTNIECVLYHGANDFVRKLQAIFEMM